MTTNEQVFELLENTGLNWTVNKNQLFDKDGKETLSYGMFRNDNGNWLGTVGDRYTPLQNKEIAEILINASEGLNIQMKRGGSLGGGQKVYLQAALPDEIIGNSPVKRLLTCLNSHDGSTSVGFGSTNTTVICQNTFFRAYGELMRFRHTATMKARIEIAQKDLRQTMHLDKELMTTFKVMADTKLNESIVEKVIRKMFDVSKDTQQSELSTRKKNQITGFAQSLTKSVEEQGQTVWALFNGVTRYTNHVAAPKENKLDYIMVNGGASLSNISYNEIMKYIEENTEKKIYSFSS